MRSRPLLLMKRPSNHNLPRDRRAAAAHPTSRRQRARGRPDPSVVAKLSPFELDPLLNAYRIRMPADWISNSNPAAQVSEGTTLINGGWHKMGPDNKPLCSLDMIVFDLDKTQDVSKFDFGYFDVLVRVKYAKANFKKEPTEKGDINGVEFSRYHWSGDKNGQKFRGLLYVGKDDRHVLSFILSVPAEGHGSELKLMENAVLTLRKP